MDDATAYESLAEAHGGEERWAYGTGFDDALVLSQRLAGWVSNAPELEDEVALANIALDLLGQARLLLTRAAAADPALRPDTAPAHIPDEDALAYFRAPAQFRNVVLAEVDDGGDFAGAIVRLFLLATWRLGLMQRLASHADPVLAAIAAKAVFELTYHRDYAAGWLVRLGDGTDESHARTQVAADRIVPLAAELREADAASAAEFDGVLADVLTIATLDVPPPGEIRLRGRGGQHTTAFFELLAELQAVARADPEATW
ncbi:MAG: ring,2-phenylacetyl-CoA epoxidase subunit PaaC [Pseudonocardiales bacterium]|nr:ring,2-phenylacetyl-CoA epoxidase subunit PaaC [Pseudonocardiales bacterium]